MRKRLIIPLLGIFGLCPGAGAAIGVCTMYREAYTTEIKSKIQAGVPFELMSTVFEDGRLIDKKALRIGYNLWDELVTIKTGEQIVAHFSLPSGEAELCKYLELETPILAGKKYVFRLLLNPLWGERLTRLQVATNRSFENGKLMGVNWQKLATEMPSDKVLLEKEFGK